MERQAKLLRPLSTTSVPARHVVFDTEARERVVGGQARQYWQLGAAAFLRIDQAGELLGRTEVDYNDPLALWRDVSLFTRERGRTVVWAHNLAYDLRVSRALRLLPRLGFKLSGIVLERTASWASWTQGRRTIICCDLASWLPTTLAQIARDLDTQQHPIDVRVAGAEELLARCRADVDVTADAVLHLLRFVQREDCGPFRPTGSGQSHAFYRRRFLTHRLLAHDNSVALERERRAMWTGRCEAWRWGRLGERGMTEFDLETAYCHIAAEQTVPTRLVGATGPLDAGELAGALEAYAVMAEVDVTCSLPALPRQIGERIDWPVGSFSTVLWSPELTLAGEVAEQLVVRRAWLYERAPALRDFATFVLDQLARPTDELHPLDRRLLKHWSRTLVGRMALRYRRWEPFGLVREHDARLGLYVDGETGTVTDSLQVGGDYLTLGAMIEADTSLPQITGFVMSEARRRLWALMRFAKLENLIYLDTDSLLVNAAGAKRLRAAIAMDAAWSLREKQAVRAAEIVGPRNLEIAGERRTAGIPKTATRVGVGEYEGVVWRSLRGSLTTGELDFVSTTARRFDVAELDPRRDHLPEGYTSAHDTAAPLPA